MSPSRDAEPAQLVISLIEQEVLPRLQSGEEAHLVVAQKQPQVVTLPALPGAAPRANSSLPPVISKSGAAPGHWHKEPLLGLVYVVRGEVDLLLSRRVVTCQAGNFAFFLPHTWSDRGTTAHWKQAGAARGDCDLLWLYVRPQEVLSHASWLRGTQHTGARHLFIPDNRMLPLFELLHEEATLDPISPAASQLLWLIYERVRRKLREERFFTSHLSVREIPGFPDEAAGSIGQRAQKYVDANLMERLTLESVARAIFVSRSRLAHEFREYTGETFGAYLLRRRIERAQQLLTTASCSIKEVAWRAGFPDADYFSAAFRREVGSTPTEFRKERR